MTLLPVKHGRPSWNNTHKKGSGRPLFPLAFISS